MIESRIDRFVTHLLALTFAALVGTSAMARELALAANEKSREQTVAALLIKDIYSRSGLGVSIEPVPGKRATQMALAGIKDGETARISPYAAANPPLMRVDPAFYRLTTGVFAKAGRVLKIRSKTDLAPYRVGVVRGIAHAERAVEGHRNVEFVAHYDQLYRMIAAGRIDVGIDTGINGDAEIKALGLDGKVVHHSDIAVFELHNILTPHNADVAPAIAGTIKQMKATGELAKLARKYEKQVIESWSAQASGQSSEEIRIVRPSSR